jgi:hypothetical protein
MTRPGTTSQTSCLTVDAISVHTTGMTSTTQHSNSSFYGAKFDIFDQEYPQDKHTFTVHTVHPKTGDLWASTDDGEQVHVPADEIPSDIRMTSTPTGVEVVGEDLAEHYDRGVTHANRHAHQKSIRLGVRHSRLSEWTYARSMSDTAAASGDHQNAAYWAGYSAEARRIDPNKQHVLLTD